MFLFRPQICSGLHSYSKTCVLGLSNAVFKNNICTIMNEGYVNQILKSLLKSIIVAAPFKYLHNKAEVN